MVPLTVLDRAESIRQLYIEIRHHSQASFCEQVSAHTGRTGTPVANCTSVLLALAALGARKQRAIVGCLTGRSSPVTANSPREAGS